MPKAAMAQLSQSLQQVVDTLRPSAEEQHCQREAFQQVQAVMLKRWPDAQVHLFGSTANCLSICNNNDIDVCLELQGDVQDQVMTIVPIRTLQCMAIVCSLSLLEHICSRWW